jgi:hypothetical protein
MDENNDDRQLPEVNPHEPERRGHEERDINVRAIGKFAIGLSLLCIGTLAIIFGAFRYFEAREAGPAPPPRNIAAQDGTPLEPRLQEVPVEDLKQMRAAEDQILGSYGWVDKQKGIVRLPIDRANDLLAQRGLPSRPENAPVSAASNVSLPGEGGLGQKMIPPGGPLASEAGEGMAR